jgi:hypothetical protein
MKKLALGSLITATLIGGASCIPRFDWTEPIQVAPNTHVDLTFWNKGGLLCFRFEQNSNAYSFETPHTPFIITADADHAYVVCFDRETSFEKTTFRYFRSGASERFTEIDRREFPKHLAIQNWWWGKGREGDEERARAEAMDPKDVWFCRSLTARVWLHIEQGIHYYENIEPSEQFVALYKQTHIDGQAMPNNGMDQRGR